MSGFTETPTKLTVEASSLASSRLGNKKLA